MAALLRIRGVAPSDDPYKAYLERLLKLIPSEAVGLYLAGRSAIQATFSGNSDSPAEALAGTPNALPYWAGWTLFCLVAVIWVRGWATSDRENDLGPEWPAVAIAAVSFIVWAHSLRDLFAQFHGVWLPPTGDPRRARLDVCSGPSEVPPLLRSCALSVPADTCCNDQAQSDCGSPGKN